MKKLLFVTALVSLFCTSVFAEKIKVQTVEGKVTFQNGNEWVSVKEGMILDTEDSINVGLNASIKFDNDLFIKPMKKGKIAELVVRSGNRDTIILGSSLTRESIKTLASADKASSAAGRASEAKEDLDWDE